MSYLLSFFLGTYAVSYAATTVFLFFALCAVRERSWRQQWRAAVIQGTCQLAAAGAPILILVTGDGPFWDAALQCAETMAVAQFAVFVFGLALHRIAGERAGRA